MDCDHHIYWYMLATYILLYAVISYACLLQLYEAVWLQICVKSNANGVSKWCDAKSVSVNGLPILSIFVGMGIFQLLCDFISRWPSDKTIKMGCKSSNFYFHAKLKNVFAQESKIKHYPCTITVKCKLGLCQHNKKHNELGC